MQKESKDGFKVIGIKVRTSNKDGQAAKDIGQLWQRFMSEGVGDKIPNKIDASILSIYTNYDGDHNMPYDTILGCRVSTLEEIPEGMIGENFGGGKYAKYVAKGNLNEGIVYDAWLEIWQQDLDRTYIADFEVYGEEAMNPEDAKVDIFVGVN